MKIANNHIYLDYAATTPVDTAVLRAMRPYFSEKFGNAGSVHSAGQEAIAAIDKAREIIARSVNAEFGQIIFTGSATEANNLALRGAIRRVLNENRVLDSGDSTRSGSGQAERFNERANASDKTIRTAVASRTSVKPRVVVSAIEHESILETASLLKSEGAEVAVIPVDQKGFVDLKKLEQAIDGNTVVVSVMYASNEVGVIEPIKKISEIVRKFRGAGAYPLFHTDAVQAFQYLDCDAEELGVDMMTLSTHKIYGPKGIGALYARNKKILLPVITGGGQEYGLRSGTENVALIAGFGKAAEIAVKNRKAEAGRVGGLRDFLFSGIKKISKKAFINGPEPGPGRLPNNLSVYFPGEKAQFLLTKLDRAGIMASAGSACGARSLVPSYVVKALYGGDERSQGTIRFSLGRMTDMGELKEALKRISLIVK